MYEFDSSSECNLMNVVPNIFNPIQEGFESKETLDILDLDRLNENIKTSNAENPSNRDDPEDFCTVYSQSNGHSPSRNAQEDYNFRFLHHKSDIIDPPWKKTSHFNKLPELLENDSYSALPLIYSDVIQSDEGTLCHAHRNNSNIMQDYNAAQWNHGINTPDLLPEPIINTKKVLNVLETNNTSRKITVESANDNAHDGSWNPYQENAKAIENFHVLPGKQRNLIETKQETSGKKNVVRIVLHRMKDSQDANRNIETVERYQVILPAGRSNKDNMHTTKIQREDAHKWKCISESEDNERQQRAVFAPTIKKLSFSCQLCEEKFVTRYSLITHIKGHRQPFCSSCIILCKSREQLRQHMNRRHMAPPAPEVTVVTSKYGRKRQVFCPLSLMTRRRSVSKS